MTARAFPTAAQIEALTPVDRDRALDVIRIVSLVGVVFGHTVMATSIIDHGVFRWANLLTTSVLLQALTWVFQIMPLFFFAGVAASAGSWRAGQSWGGWLLKRCTRLYRPVFYYLAFWAVALTALHRLLPVHVYEPIAGISIQLLWFLGIYVLVLAAVPLLARITTTRQLAAAVAGFYALIAAIDAVRINAPDWAPLGYVNFVAWLIPGMFGIAYRHRLLSAQAALRLGLVMLAVNIALVWLGPYELSLVGIETQHVKNMTPPSLLLAGHAIMMCAFTIAAMPTINRWAARANLWRLAVIGNTGAMTLYLWHMPALLGIHLGFDLLGLPRYPGQPHFLLLSLVQISIMAALVAVLFVALRPLENNSLPLWDGGRVDSRGWRSAMVGTTLCVAGASTLAAVAWGLKGQGLYCVFVMLAALVSARVLAR